MLHPQVYDFFKRCLPEQESEIIEFFPNGKNSIRLRKKNGQEFIFSLQEKDAWKYETKSNFILNMKE